MFERKLKCSVIFCLLLAGLAVCANDVPASSGDSGQKKMTAPPDTEFGGFAEAQFLFGVYCKEKLKDDSRAYEYLELAAKQNHRGAWLYLAKCYFDRKEEHHSYLVWSKLCYMAAERLENDAVVEFYIGLLEGMCGNLPEYKKWMKLSADKGFKKAAEMLVDKECHDEIIAIREQRKKETQPALKRSIDSHIKKVRKLTGSSGSEIFEKLMGFSEVSQISRMIRLPLPENISLPGWTYDAAATEAYISDRLMADRFGDMRWMSDEFMKKPIWENLLYPNPTIRAINATYENRLVECLKKSSFRYCSKEETQRLIKPFIIPNMPKDYYDGDDVWDLGNNLFFRIHTAIDGSWLLRDYMFFMVEDGKSTLIETFPNPPSAEDAALIVGIIKGDEDCLNNLAVKYADGEMDHISNQDDEAEVILKALLDRSHFIGTYNYAVFCQKRKRHEEAEKYFALAERFAGSSVISYSVNPPEIFDRDGNLLVKNRLYRTGKQHIRIYTRGGRFAAALIGHIQEYEERIGRDAFSGATGIEQIISSKNLCHPVCLTLDSGLQTRLEKLITEIDLKSKPRYAYGVIVSSKGELIAAAQNIVFDLAKRDFDDPERWNFVFMPAGYLFPVPDQWMKLLGSASTADPLSKEKFKFHQKQLIFTGEAQGVVLGLNRMKGERDPRRVSGQTATMLNYVCAYIGVTEKKAVPKLSIYTDDINTAVKINGGIKWISFYRPPDGIVVNALGVIKTSDPGNDLYVCVRAVYEERNFSKPLSKDAVRAAAENGDKAEKIIKDFSLTAKTK